MAAKRSAPATDPAAPRLPGGLRMEVACCDADQEGVWEGDWEECEVVADYGAWLAQSDVAKLFVNADPGSILTGRPREVCRQWPNQTEVTVKGYHFIQEDSPHEIGRAVADWLPTR